MSTLVHHTDGNIAWRGEKTILLLTDLPMQQQVKQRQLMPLGRGSSLLGRCHMVCIKPLPVLFAPFVEAPNPRLMLRLVPLAFPDILLPGGCLPPVAFGGGLLMASVIARLLLLLLLLLILMLLMLLPRTSGWELPGTHHTAGTAFLLLFLLCTASHRLKSRSQMVRRMCYGQARGGRRMTRQGGRNNQRQ